MWVFIRNALLLKTCFLSLTETEFDARVSQRNICVHPVPWSGFRCWNRNVDRKWLLWIDKVLVLSILFYRASGVTWWGYVSVSSDIF